MPLIILGVSQINRVCAKALLVPLLIGLGIFSLFTFVLIERRASNPIVDLSLFKNRVFSSAIWGLFLTFMAYPAYILVMPFYLIQGIGLVPAKAGLVLAAVSMTSIFVGPISGWLSDRFGSVWFSTMGALVTTIAFILMRGFDLQTQIMGIVPVLVILGLGMGLFQSPNNSTIMGAVTKERLGTASALIATQRSVGIAVGTALAGTVYSARKIIHINELSQQGLEAAAANQQAISSAFQDVLLISVFFIAVVVVLSLGTRSKTR